MKRETARHVGQEWLRRANRAPLDAWWTTVNAPYGDPEAAAVAFSRELAGAVAETDMWMMRADADVPSVLLLADRTSFEAAITAIESRELRWSVTARTVDPARLRLTRQVRTTPDSFDQVASRWTVSFDEEVGRLVFEGTASYDGELDRNERFGWALAALAGWRLPDAEPG